MKIFTVVLLSVIFTLNVINADDCTCTIYILTDKGERDFIYSTTATWSDSCKSKSADNDCQQACYTMVEKMTNDGDLNSHPMGSDYPDLGDLACLQLDHDVGLSTFEGDSQACNHTVKTKPLPTKQPFCCKNGDWPNGKC